MKTWLVTGEAKDSVKIKADALRIEAGVLQFWRASPEGYVFAGSPWTAVAPGAWSVVTEVSG